MRGVGNDRCDHVAGVLSSTPDLGLASLAKRDRMAKSVMMFANSSSTNRECHLPFRHGSRARSRRRILRLPVSAPIESTSTLNLHSAWPGHAALLRGALQASASGYGRAISRYGFARCSSVCERSAIGRKRICGGVERIQPFKLPLMGSQLERFL